MATVAHLIIEGVPHAIDVDQTCYGWEVSVDGEDSHISAQPSEQAARDAIAASWGRAPWDLQWI